MILFSIVEILGKTIIVLLLLLIALIAIWTFQDHPDQVNTCLVNLSNRCYTHVNFPND